MLSRWFLGVRSIRIFAKNMGDPYYEPTTVVHERVAVEPPLLLLNGETIAPVSAICNDETRADVHVTGFWGRRQGVFLTRI